MIKALLDRIVEASIEESRYFESGPPGARRGPPASDAEIQELEIHLASFGAKLPNSFRIYLETYNGIENFMIAGYHLLSVHQIIDRAFPPIEEFEEEFPSIAKFVIAGGETGNFTGFDLDKPHAPDEYDVVEISRDGDEWRTSSFVDFLEQYLRGIEDHIEMQRRDRENLPD